jgi:hypothetical protein
VIEVVLRRAAYLTYAGCVGTALSYLFMLIYPIHLLIPFYNTPITDAFGIAIRGSLAYYMRRRYSRSASVAQLLMYVILASSWLIPFWTDMANGLTLTVIAFMVFLYWNATRATVVYQRWLKRALI